MKKTTLLLALFLSVTSISAYADSVRTIVENNESITSNVQQNHISNRSLEADSLTLDEPEFVNSYCILTSDSTYTALPKETGIVGPHKNKTTSLLGKIGKIADAASAIGGLGSAVGLSANSSKTVLSGVKASMTAMSVSDVADAASALTGAVGMDIIFSGKASSFNYKKNGQDIRILIKAENNEYDPHSLYRLVKFSTTKKERRIQWLQIDSGVIDEDAKNKGYIPFHAEKYGKQSYLLTIPYSCIEKGEYGIVFMGAESVQHIPVATFSIS